MIVGNVGAAAEDDVAESIAGASADSDVLLVAFRQIPRDQFGGEVAEPSPFDGARNEAVVHIPGDLAAAGAAADGLAFGDEAASAAAAHSRRLV